MVYLWLDITGKKQIVRRDQLTIKKPVRSYFKKVKKWLNPNVKYVANTLKQQNNSSLKKHVSWWPIGVCIIYCRLMSWISLFFILYVGPGPAEYLLKIDNTFTCEYNIFKKYTMYSRRLICLKQ